MKIVLIVTSVNFVYCCFALQVRAWSCCRCHYETTIGWKKLATDHGQEGPMAEAYADRTTVSLMYIRSRAQFPISDDAKCCLDCVTLQAAQLV